MELRYGKMAAAAVLLAALAVAVRGIGQGSSSGTCYETVKTCHGVPFSGDCFGSVDYTTNFDSREQCKLVSNITRRCNSIGDKICELNNRSIGTSWASKSEAFGKKCSAWSSEYDLQLRSC